MDSARYTVRPFEDADYEPVARINAVVDPQFSETAEDSRHWHDMLTREPGHIMQKWVAEEVGPGSIVAWGGLCHTLHNYHPDKYFLRAVVLPEHRRRGIGEALYTLIEGVALGRRAVCVWSTVREDDPASVHFQERHGFAPTRTVWASRLDLTHCDLSRLPDRSEEMTRRGIRFSTLADDGVDREDVLHRLYELGLRTWGDAPRMGHYTPPTYETFLESTIRGPRFLPEGTFLASLGEKCIGWSSLEKVPGRVDVIDIGFTGTLPEYRGLGIATELKRRAIRYAQSRGFRSLTTNNDSLNPSIWAINEKLGFRREWVLINGEKVTGPLVP